MNEAWDGPEGIARTESGNTFSDTVINHATNPRNAGSIPDADAYAFLLGPCADKMEVWLKVRNGRVEDASFWTDGCGATIACGSMTTELVKGKTLGEVLAITAEAIATNLGGLPEDHVHCAGLASSTLKKAVAEYLNTRREPWKRSYGRH
ncbi:MAG: iron-sulfur cluster assembly scaffold protein [Chloroflexota bacterium]